MLRPALLVGLIALAVTGLLDGCGESVPSATKLSLLHRGLSAEPATLDPASVTDTFSAEVLRDLYEGLTAEAPDGTVIPGVAQSWDVDAGGTHYVFHLRPDAQWSDGASVTAMDFVSAWRRVVDPKQGTADADLLRTIKGTAAIISGRAPTDSLGAIATDAQTLTVTLEQPAPFFLGLLSHAAAYPVRSDAHARSHDPKTWVSNGPYVLVAWQPGTSVKLTRNAKYWDNRHVAIDAVSYQFAADDAAQLRGYRAGELDLTDNIPAGDLATLKREQPREVHIAPFLATAYYGINLTAVPLGKSVKLRQALAMAIDRKRVVQALALGQAEAFGFVAPGTSDYTPQSWDWRNLGDEERIHQAKSLYAEAGFSPASALKLHLLYNTNPAIRQTAIVIASMWKEVLGIETVFENQEYRVFLQTRHETSSWQIARLAWAADYRDAGNFLDTLRHGSPNNDQHYANDAFDALLDEAARSTDPALRRQKLEAAERQLLSDYPIIPIYHFVSKRLVKPYVAGAGTPNVLNHLNSKWLSLGPTAGP
jgi:oligopeptide transport system substrate-binding protein